MDNRRERFYGIWMLPEIISCLLVLISLLWDVFFLRQVPQVIGDASILNSEFAMLACLVWLNSSIVLIHSIVYFKREKKLPTFVFLQLFVGLLTSIAFICYHGDLRWMDGNFWSFGLGVVGSIIIGVFGLINIHDYWQLKREKKEKVNSSAWSPAVIFFSYTFSFIVLSSLILMTPAATYDGISLPDAFFMTASAATSTGLIALDVPNTFTPLGKAVILMDIQMGAIGLMTFAYFVLMMVGKKLAVQNSANVSGLLDQDGLGVVPSLIKALVSVTLLTELAGAVLLYFFWYGEPGVPQDHLWIYAAFHSISAFCCAGISLFPNNMAESCVAYNKFSQSVMMTLMMMGMLGFGVYLELISRVCKRIKGVRVPARWSTHCWLATQSMLIATIICMVVLALLGIFEVSAHEQSATNTIWEALWNSVGRSSGFNITTVDDYGFTYKFFLIFAMMIGGNPAGTGGGFFAPVLAICILEVWRVLRGKQDLEIHQRRIAKTTIRRAMVTVVIGTAWLYLMTMVFMLLEPDIAAMPNGFQRIMFEVTSAFSTCGFSLGITSQLSDVSKILLAMNMIFGRIGVFTFMMLFVRQSQKKLLRYPETKLPLS
ncbi:MAG: potassium transporter TrkG [Akkermansia sp.]